MKILVRVLLVVVGLLLAAIVGAAIRGKSGTAVVDQPTTVATTISTTTTLPPGCQAIQTFRQELATAPLSQIAVPGTPWYTISGLQSLPGTIGQDARGFVQATAISETTGNLAIIQAATDRLAADC